MLLKLRLFVYLRLQFHHIDEEKIKYREGMNVCMFVCVRCACVLECICMHELCLTT